MPDSLPLRTIAFALLASAGLAFAAGLPDAVEPEQTISLDRRGLFETLASEMAVSSGHLQVGYATYMNRARTRRDAWSAWRAYEIARSAGASKQMLEAAELWKDFAGNDPNAAIAVIASKLRTKTPFASLRAECAQWLPRWRQADLEKSAALEVLLALQAGSPDKKADFEPLMEVFGENVLVEAAPAALAEIALAAGNVAKAQGYAEAARRANPDDPYASLLYLAAFFETDARKAMDAARDYVKKHPEDKDFRYGLARALVNFGKRREALEAIAPLEPLAGANPRIAYAVAEIHLYAASHAKAAQNLRLFLSGVGPNPPASERERFERAHLVLGGYELDAQRHEEARKHYLAIGEKSPVYRQARIALAESYGAQKAYGKALSCLDELVRQNPKDAELLVRKARIEAALKDKKAVRKTVEEALRLAGDDPDVLYWAGIAASEVGLTEKADAIFARGIDKHPGKAVFYNALGYSYLERGTRLPEAKGLIAKALELDPENAMYVDSWGWYLYLVKDFASAESFLKKAHDKAPGEPEIALHLAKVYAALGKVGDAETIARQILAKDPGDAQARAFLHSLGVKP